jgi:hypothetical protein
MREIRVATDVDAPVEAVWAVLSDLASYGEWNPQLTSVRGELREGARVRIRVAQSSGRERSMTATVAAVDPGRRLEWVGTVVGSWLFEGRHAVELEALDDGRTRVTNRERLSGLLVPFVVPDDVERDYEAANRALAARAERLLAEGRAG